MTVGRISQKKYIFISLSWAFSKTLGLTSGQNDDPVTRTWKMTQMTDWPGDPMTKFHVSLSASSSSDNGADSIPSNI